MSDAPIEMTVSSFGPVIYEQILFSFGQYGGSEECHLSLKWYVHLEQ